MLPDLNQPWGGFEPVTPSSSVRGARLRHGHGLPVPLLHHRPEQPQAVVLRIHEQNHGQQVSQVPARKKPRFAIS